MKLVMSEKEVCDIVSRYLSDEKDLNVENIELRECSNVIELHADIVVDD
mgnify:CR=1 FL=1